MVDMTLFWSLVASLSLFANRVAEGVKRGLKVRFPTLSEDLVGLITLLISFIAAFIGALFINLNFFDVLPDNPYTARIPEVVGIIVVAGAAAFGGEALHWFLDLLSATTKRIEAPAAGGFTQKSETTFTAPSGNTSPAGTTVDMTTPAGSATLTPPPAAPPDPHG